MPMSAPYPTNIQTKTTATAVNKPGLKVTVAKDDNTTEVDNNTSVKMHASDAAVMAKAGVVT